MIHACFHRSDSTTGRLGCCAMNPHHEPLLMRSALCRGSKAEQCDEVEVKT